MSDIIFRADSVRHAFGSRLVLNAATLWARERQVTVLLGRNGCGKSTLFRVAAGLVQPQQGAVLFRGRAHARPRLHQLALDGLYYLPERGLLVGNRTVRDMFALIARRFGGSVHVEAAIEQLRIGDLLERMEATLSGGERRRVEVALAIARAPAVLIADEPLMGEAPLDAELLCSALRGLADSGCAVVVSGHEVPQLMAVADEVVWMVAGTTHGLGPPARAREQWQFRREYLGA